MNAQSHSEADDAALSLEEVVAGYGRMTILTGTSFRVRRGGITTIIGPNGAGKSTVFKTVFGLLRPRSGRIHCLGTNVTNAAPRTLLASGLAYVPQGRNVFPELSVRHNLELGGWSVRKSGDLDARIAEAVQRFPVLAEKADQQASVLSGGEQKMLEVARAMLLRPSVLLIDEPSIGLSPVVTKDVFGLLEGLRDTGVTVLMVEQNARSALQISDDAIVMDQGRTRMTGTAAEILADPRIGHLMVGGSID
jgi:branched-chain amino acid transport system ATP-binding protein